MSWSGAEPSTMSLDITTDTSDSSSITETTEEGRPKVPQINAYKSLRYYLEQLREKAAKLGEQAVPILGACTKAIMEPATKANERTKAAALQELLAMLAKASALSHAQLLKQVQAAERLLVLLHVLLLYLHDDGTPFLTPDQVATVVNAASRITLLGSDDASLPNAQQQSQRPLAADIRIAALFAIAVLAHRHAELMVPHWNVLFPDVDACKQSSRHTLFTPLLHDRLNFARSAAAAAINHIIAKTQSKVQLADEPSAKRQSFTSLSAMVGKVILNAHQVFVFGICHEKWPKKMRIMYLPTFAAISSVTPYEKLPRTREVLLGFMRNDKAHAELFGMGLSEGHVVCSSLAAIWRNRAAVRTLAPFLSDESQSGTLLSLVFGLLPDLEAWKAVHALAANYTATVAPRLRQCIEAVARTLRKQERSSVKDIEVILEALRGISQYFVNAAAQRTVSGEVSAAVRVGAVFFFADALSPSLSFPSEAIRCEAYRSVGSLDEALVQHLAAAQRREMVTRVVDVGLMEPSSLTRKHAFETVAAWAWSHSSLREFHSVFVNACINTLLSDTDMEVLEKAALVMSNLCGRLGDLPEVPIRDVALLATGATSAIRMRSNTVLTCCLQALGAILAALPEDDLIMEIEGHPDGICNAGLEYLAQFCINSSNHLVRGSAVLSAGQALSRREVFTCDPEAAAKLMDALLSEVAKDKNFKVRANAAVALRCVHPQTLGASAAPAVAALCSTLASSAETKNFAQFKESQGLRLEAAATLRLLLSFCGIAVAAVAEQAPPTLPQQVARSGWATRPMCEDESPRSSPVVRRLLAASDAARCQLAGAGPLVAADVAAVCRAVIGRHEKLLQEANVLPMPEVDASAPSRPLQFDKDAP